MAVVDISALVLTLFIYLQFITISGSKGSLIYIGPIIN
jgi:hypothetical protein